jgi:hypothetical protein
MDIIYQLLYEIGFFCFLGLIYYIFQKRKIKYYVATEKNAALGALDHILDIYSEKEVSPSQRAILNDTRRELNLIIAEDSDVELLSPNTYDNLIKEFQDDEEIIFVVQEVHAVLWA